MGFTGGQVRGGRWKPLHYLLASTLYRDHFAACGSAGQCYVKSDYPLGPSSGTLSLSLERLSDGAHIAIKSVPVALSAGANAFLWLCAGSSAAPPSSCPAWSTVLAKLGCAANGSNCVLNASLSAPNSSAPYFTNLQLLTAPSGLSLPTQAPVAVSIGVLQSDGSVPVTVSSAAPVLYVHLTTLASGRFSDNSFSLISTRSTTVSFIPIDGPANVTLLQSSLRAEHLGQYLTGM